MSAKNCILTNDKVEKMTEIIGYLPKFHRDAVYIRHDSSDDKVNSFQWVADELSQDYGTFISAEFPGEDQILDETVVISLER